MGIIRKAADYQNDTTLVFGLTGSGKSTYAIRKALEVPGRILYLAFGSTAVISLLSEEERGRIDVAEINNWASYIDEVVPVLKEYATVVMDGLNPALGLILDMKNGSSGNVVQSDWAEASNLLRNQILIIRGRVGRLVAAVDVIIDSESGDKKLALNPHSVNMLLPLFSSKVYCYTEPRKDAKTQKVSGVNYAIESETALAIRFINVSK